MVSDTCCGQLHAQQVSDTSRDSLVPRTMRATALWWVGVVLCAWSPSAHADPAPDATDPNLVSVLTTANWASELAASPSAVWLVKFYAPWCGHCKRLAPAFAQIAAEMEGAPVRLARVDATVEKELAKRFEVTGYPTLMIFASGGREQWEYAGPRTKPALVSLLERMQRPAVEEIADDKAFQGVKDVIKESGRIHFVLCRPAGAKGGETPSAHILETFSRVARLRQPLDHFAATSAPSVVASILSRAPKGSTDSPQPFLARLSPGERAVEILPFERLASMDASRLEAFFLSWVEMGRLPYFSIVNKDNFSELLTMKRNGGRTLVLGVVRPPHDETTGAPLNLTLAAALGAPRRRGGGLARELRALAMGGGEGEGSDEAEKATQRLRASYLYGLLDGVWFENFTSAYGILPDELPRVLVLKGGNPRSFRVDELGSDRGPQAHTRAGLDAQPSTPSPILATPVPLSPPSPTLTHPHPHPRARNVAQLP